MHSLKSLAMELETIVNCGIEILVNGSIQAVPKPAAILGVCLGLMVFSWRLVGSQDEPHLEI